MIRNSLKTIISFICLTIYFSGYTLLSAQQSEVITTNNAKESLQVAQELISVNEFKKAIKQLKHTIKIKKDFAVAYRLLGKVYYEMNDFEQAAKTLEQSFELDKKLSRAAFYECGDSFLKTGNLDKANYYLGIFSEMKDKNYANVKKESALELSYDEMIEVKKKNISFISELDTSTNASVTILPLDKINSPNNEYLPSLSNDGDFLLFTRNKNGDQEDIYLSKKTPEGWGNENQGAININTSKNEGMAKFEPHNYKVYYAGCSRHNEIVNCDIFESEFIDGQLNKEIELTGDLNSPFWDSQPAVSCDGQTMYFASSREGGLGGSDIWVSQRANDGSWAAAENLGDIINTKGDEEAPFIAKDGKALYFTSNHHPGQGEGDFFVCFKKNGNWQKPLNLGYPINSPSKELGLYISDDAEKIFFSSARPGGKGGLDIYEADLPDIYKPVEVLPVALNLRDKETDEVIIGTITVGVDKLRENYTTDNNGNVQLCLAGDKAYSFRVNKEGYEFYVEAFYLESIAGNQIQNIKLALNKKKEPEPFKGEKRHTKTVVQIYFESNSFSIDEKNSKKLKDLAELMNTYDDWTITVTGFADSVGDEAYNQKLSKDRAQTVVDYLAQFSDKEITQNIKALGKGSISTDGSDESKQKSRRVDIVLKR